MPGAALTPLRVGKMQLRNRIVRAAHGVLLPWSDDGGEHVPYHVERAKGGVAMSILGIGGVHPTNPAGIPTHDDSVLPGLRAITDAVHEHDMKLVVQIWHGGAQRANRLGGAAWSSSAIPSPATGMVPRPMTHAMIEEMVASFAAAARRVRDGGADGVEIHAANGYLINQFLSPAWNHREDEYGGSLENRLRFLHEVLDAVRAEVGDFTVGTRLTSNEFIKGGLEPTEVAEMARSIEPKIDFLSVSMGSYVRPDLINAPMDEPLGYQVEQSEQITRAVSIPTIVTGRIMTVDQADHIVESGVSDMVSMVRGLIADPEIVVKSQTRRDAEIRPCIGVSLCIGSTLTGTFNCAVNPSAGHERERPPHPDPAATQRRVLVVGGGPAGMEAARLAALRGHEVVLCEMRRELGGQVRMAARAPYRADFQAITLWQADELTRLGVKVMLSHPVDPDVVAEIAPDVLVVATGSEPSEGAQVARPAAPIPGSALPHVHTSWDLFGAGRGPTLGEHVLVFDDGGEYEALSVADELVARGVEVTFVTPFDGYGERILARSNTTAPVLRRLTAAGVQLVTRSELVSIEAGRVQVARGGTPTELLADSVVLVGVKRPNRDLVDYLELFTGEVHVIGDADGFHTLAKAIDDGDAVGRRI